MRVHFIAIGGSAMHNLAIALHRKGVVVTGSDDEIFEPSRGRLDECGLLPDREGWDTSRISGDLDAIIIGMHAREDNPELAAARSLGLPIYSYPEFVYEQTRDKKRVVIGGSHGKTTITSMVLHALHHNKRDCDYLVGALLDGFDCSVKLSEHTDLAVFEGDEYLASPLDRRPKFHLYHPHIALISGIAWDHMNVFPTYANYLEQFEQFIRCIEEGGTLIYSEEDNAVKELVESKAPDHLHLIPYATPNYRIESGCTYIDSPQGTFEVQVFGRHNLQNLEGARLICETVGIQSTEFYTAMESFTGASRRLEKLVESDTFIAYRDFAHAPSKLKATTAAVREMYPQKRVVACIELHTFSSLNKSFLPHYAHTMKDADEALVYFNPQVVEHKQLPKITENDIRSGFQREGLIVCTSNGEVQKFIDELDKANTVLLLMSSGNWGGGLNVEVK